MHPRFRHFKRAEARGDAFRDDAAFETEPQNNQPIRVAARAAGFDRLVDRLLRDRAELRADVEIRLLLAARAAIKAFGAQIGVRERLDAQKDRLLVLGAVFHAGGLQMREDPRLERARRLRLRLRIEALRADRLELLQRFDRERPGHAQFLFVLARLIKERRGVRRLVVGERFQRDMRHGFVVKALPDVLRVMRDVIREGRGHQALFGDVQGDARRVNRNPPPPPLLGDVGRRAAAAGRIDDEIAGIRRH